MMTPELRTIHMGMIKAVERLGFGFGLCAETGAGRGCGTSLSSDSETDKGLSCERPSCFSKWGDMTVRRREDEERIARRRPKRTKTGKKQRATGVRIQGGEKRKLVKKWNGDERQRRSVSGSQPPAQREAARHSDYRVRRNKGATCARPRKYSQHQNPGACSAPCALVGKRSGTCRADLTGRM